jgi:hypothetical protein
MSIFLSLYPKNSAIASGATPIRSAIAHPIERSRQKKDEKLRQKARWWTSDFSIIGYISSTTNFDYIVDKIKIDYSHRELFMRVKKDNSIISGIVTVKQGYDI